MLITAANNVDTSKVAVPERVQPTYQHDIDAHKLELQLKMLPDLAKAPLPMPTNLASFLALSSLLLSPASSKAVIGPVIGR